MPDKHNNKIGNNEIGNGFDADLHSYRLVQRNCPCLGKFLRTRPYPDHLTVSIAIFSFIIYAVILTERSGTLQKFVCNTVKSRAGARLG